MHIVINFESAEPTLTVTSFSFCSILSIGKGSENFDHSCHVGASLGITVLGAQIGYRLILKYADNARIKHVS